MFPRLTSKIQKFKIENVYSEYKRIVCPQTHAIGQFMSQRCSNRAMLKKQKNKNKEWLCLHFWWKSTDKGVY